MLRRLSFLLTTLILGLAISAVVAQKIAVSRIVSTRIAPVRTAYEEDWKQHLASVEAALEQSSSWNASLEALPTTAWCALPWTGAAAGLAPLQHACATGEDGPEPDWVDAFHSADGWTDFLSHGWTAGQLPTVQSEKLETDAFAAADLLDLGRALVNAPDLSTQLSGVKLLERAGAPNREALTLARAAGAMVFHPWTPDDVRTRLLSKLPLASRCAALDEAGRIASYGAAVRESYGPWLDAMQTSAPGACPGVRWPVDESEAWKRALATSGLVESGSTTEAVVLFVAQRDAKTRAAVIDSLIAVTLLKPFPGKQYGKALITFAFRSLRVRIADVPYGWRKRDDVHASNNISSRVR